MSKNIFHIAIFASGTGSNTQKIIDYFETSRHIKIALIVCNNPRAGVLQIAAAENIPLLIIEKKFFKETGYMTELRRHQINFIILAGFLWKVPLVLTSAFKNRIINIHPALLPSFGGKGMYGNAVHEAVLSSKETKSGITIHYVDEIYDHGRIIFQASCIIDENETPETLAAKIHALEHQFYAKEIEKLLT